MSGRGSTMERSPRFTVLELVEAVQDTASSDDEVVAIIAHMLKTGRVLISGGVLRRIEAALAN